MVNNSAPSLFSFPTNLSLLPALLPLSLTLTIAFFFTLKSEDLILPPLPLNTLPQSCKLFSPMAVGVTLQRRRDRSPRGVSVRKSPTEHRDHTSEAHLYGSSIVLISKIARIGGCEEMGTQRITLYKTIPSTSITATNTAAPAATCMNLGYT